MSLVRVRLAKNTNTLHLFAPCTLEFYREKLTGCLMLAFASHRYICAPFPEPRSLLVTRGAPAKLPCLFSCARALQRAQSPGNTRRSCLPALGAGSLKCDAETAWPVTQGAETSVRSSSGLFFLQLTWKNTEGGHRRTGSRGQVSAYPNPGLTKNLFHFLL